MKISLVNLIFFLILSFSCSQDPYTAKLGYGTINSFSKKMHQKQHWSPIAIGGIYGDETIKRMDIEFNCFEKADLSLARKMIIQGIEGFLSEINNNKKITPYLSQTPYTYENIFFGIVFDEADAKFISPPYIAHAFLIKDEICYSIFNPETKQLENIHRETYEEALQIVTNENPELLQVH